MRLIATSVRNGGAPPSPLFLSACHDHPIENKREELVPLSGGYSRHNSRPVRKVGARTSQSYVNVIVCRLLTLPLLAALALLS
ncbi:hypothetical protein J6590_030487 [Homalodisca vitripennis]|nr:hypothetical protein J6590_030487 [Homalodisca vitripennis]